MIHATVFYAKKQNESCKKEAGSHCELWVVLQEAQ